MLMYSSSTILQKNCVVNADQIMTQPQSTCVGVFYWIDFIALPFVVDSYVNEVSPIL